MKPTSYYCVSSLNSLMLLVLVTTMVTANFTRESTKLESLTKEAPDIKSQLNESESEPGDSLDVFKGTVIIDYTIPGVEAEEDLLHWKPPEEFRRFYPYYLSGFDYKNQPIWISEFGKMDLSNHALHDKKSQALFEKYCRQATYFGVKSQEIRSTPENPVTMHNVLLDMEGTKFDEISNTHVVQYIMRLTHLYRRYFEKNVGRLIVINVNSLTMNLTNLLRPFFGRILDRIEIHGTNKRRWIPQILKYFPKDEIPEWYGGSHNHKPIVVMG